MSETLQRFDPVEYSGGHITDDKPLRAQVDLPSEEPSYDPAVWRRQDQIGLWDAAKTSLERELAEIRERLEAILADQIANQPELATNEAFLRRRRDGIAGQLAVGAYAGTYTYNHSGNPAHRKTQHYYHSVDKWGNVLRTYERVSPPIGISGKPRSVGPHMWHRNPRYAIIVPPAEQQVA